jgi:acylglycerol kinase
LRREDGKPYPPLGVLPTGANNVFCFMMIDPKKMPTNKVEEIRCLATAALAVVKGVTENKDVMKIQLIQSSESQESEEIEPNKPFYAVGSLFWGSFNDIIKRKDKYWITGSLREYTAFLFNGFGRKNITWNCKANILYSDPCSGCSNCYNRAPKANIGGGRWWSKFEKNHETSPDFSKILNPNCLNNHEMTIDTSELLISTNTVEGAVSDSPSKLNIKVSNKTTDKGFDYILSCWKRLRTRRFMEIPNSRQIEARTVVLFPENKVEKDEEIYFSIDNEPYEVRPVKITLLPKRLEFITM